MIDINGLKAAMVKKGLTQREVANKLGMSQRTFSARLAKGVFGSDEIEKLMNILDISNPVEIFFAKDVT